MALRLPYTFEVCVTLHFFRSVTSVTLVTLAQTFPHPVDVLARNLDLALDELDHRLEAVVGPPLSIYFVTASI